MKMINQNPRQIVMKYIADKLRDAKSLIDNPRGFWRERDPVRINSPYPEFELGKMCGDELEVLGAEIRTSLEIAEALGYVKDSGERYNRIWDRNYKRLRKFCVLDERGYGVLGWWERR